jgi:glycosyltransferase involved in cell wall biosynthesis
MREEPRMATVNYANKDKLWYLIYMRKIGIVIFDYVLGYSPLIINSAQLLARAGYEVHIFVDASTYDRGKIDFGEKNVVINPIDITHDNAKAAKPSQWIKLVSVFSADGALRRLGLHRPLIRDQYIRAIAAYYQLFHDRGTLCAKLERDCARVCNLIVIQDEKRGAHFVQEDDVPPEKLVYVPVSGLREPYWDRGNFFHEELGVPQDKRILLHAGGFQDRAMCLELVEAARDWPEDLVLVLHSPTTAWLDSPYVDKSRHAVHSKVYLSLNPVAWEKVPDMISSADIGLVFYQDLGENFRETGHASNKLVHYLQVGLPVIASDYPSIMDVITAYHCGEGAGSPRDIEYLARRILDDYERYKANAFRCYESEYDFSKHFRKVTERIKQIAASS